MTRILTSVAVALMLGAGALTAGMESDHSPSPRNRSSRSGARRTLHLRGLLELSTR